MGFGIKQCVLLLLVYTFSNSADAQDGISLEGGYGGTFGKNLHDSVWKEAREKARLASDLHSSSMWMNRAAPRAAAALNALNGGHLMSQSGRLLEEYPNEFEHLQKNNPHYREDYNQQQRLRMKCRVPKQFGPEISKDLKWDCENCCGSDECCLVGSGWRSSSGGYALLLLPLIRLLA